MSVRTTELWPRQQYLTDGALEPPTHATSSASQDYTSRRSRSADRQLTPAPTDRRQNSTPSARAPPHRHGRYWARKRAWGSREVVSPVFAGLTVGALR